MKREEASYRRMLRGSKRGFRARVGRGLALYADRGPKYLPVNIYPGKGAWV